MVIIMIEKTIHLASRNYPLDITASMRYQADFTDIEINGNISFALEKSEVIKAYIINGDMSESNLGVIKIDYDRLYLKKRIHTKESLPKGILITKKDTSTEAEADIIRGWFDDDFSTGEKADDIPDPINHAGQILCTIKNASESKDQGISKRNCINLLKRNLEGVKSIHHTFRMFDTFYIIENFLPVVNLSAIKYVMSEGLCVHSFFEANHYLMAMRENIILLAFRAFNGQNPINHIKDFTFSLEITSETYFGVMIELADEGQYFII